MGCEAGVWREPSPGCGSRKASFLIVLLLPSWCPVASEGHRGLSNTVGSFLSGLCLDSLPQGPCGVGSDGPLCRRPSRLPAPTRTHSSAQHLLTLEIVPHHVLSPGSSVWGYVYPLGIEDPVWAGTGPVLFTTGTLATSTTPPCWRCSVHVC